MMELLERMATFVSTVDVGTQNSSNSLMTIIMPTWPIFERFIFNHAVDLEIVLLQLFAQDSSIICPQEKCD